IFICFNFVIIVFKLVFCLSNRRNPYIIMICYKFMHFCLLMLIISKDYSCDDYYHKEYFELFHAFFTSFIYGCNFYMVMLIMFPSVLFSYYIPVNFIIFFRVKFRTMFTYELIKTNPILLIQHFFDFVLV